MARLQDLKYDEEQVFPADAVFPPGVAEAAERLEVCELEALLIEQQGAVECSHPEYVNLPKELYDRAGKELVDFLANYCDLETGRLWMEGN